MYDTKRSTELCRGADKWCWESARNYEGLSAIVKTSLTLCHWTATRGAKRAHLGHGGSWRGVRGTGQSHSVRSLCVDAAGNGNVPTPLRNGRRGIPFSVISILPLLEIHSARVGSDQPAPHHRHRYTGLIRVRYGGVCILRPCSQDGQGEGDPASRQDDQRPYFSTRCWW